MLVLLAALLSACGSGESDGSQRAAAEDGSSRSERCVDRLLDAAARGEAQDEEARRYVRETYCARFERNGWIYEDGALKIGAHVWLEQSGTCATAAAGETPRTVPCDEVDERRGVLDSALLRHVRRDEVRSYLERLQREGPVACDDGTPLGGLGVP